MMMRDLHEWWQCDIHIYISSSYVLSGPPFSLIQCDLSISLSSVRLQWVGRLSPHHNNNVQEFFLKFIAPRSVQLSSAQLSSIDICVVVSVWLAHVYICVQPVLITQLL